MTYLLYLAIYLVVGFILATFMFIGVPPEDQNETLNQEIAGFIICCLGWPFVAAYCMCTVAFLGPKKYIKFLRKVRKNVHNKKSKEISA